MGTIISPLNDIIFYKQMTHWGEYSFCIVCGKYLRGKLDESYESVRLIYLFIYLFKTLLDQTVHC